MMINPESYSRKLILFYCILFVEIVLNYFVNHMDFALSGESKYSSESDLMASYVLLSVQGVIEIIICCWIFFLIWQTFLFRFGLMGMLCKEFKYLFVCIPIHIILFLIERGVRLYLSFVDGHDAISIWEQPGYLILYWIRHIFLVFFYVVLIESSLMLGDPEYYKAKKWLVC
jgi:hypothetical protein